MSAPRSESHDPFGGVQCGRARVSPHRFTITVIPAKRESTAAAAPRMQPEAIFRITYFTSSSSPTGVWVVEEQRKPPSDASVHGRSRHALPRPPHPLVSALASAAIFLRVRRRTRLCNAAPIAEIL